MVNRILFVDNSISNSDWTKANAFDFPDLKTVEDFEQQFNIPSEEPARSERLARLAVLPWVRVAPAPVRELLEGFMKQSLVKLLKASFGNDRSEAGRYAANVRWQGHTKKEPTGSKFTSKKDDEKFAQKHGNERPVGNGDCFESAVRVMNDVLSSEDKKTAKICHGVPMGQGKIEGIRFDHAWVEVTRKTDFGDADPSDPQVKFMMERFPTQVIVYDYSNGRELQMPRELYYAIGQIDSDDVKRFSAQEAYNQMSKKGFYGPWE